MWKEQTSKATQTSILSDELEGKTSEKFIEEEEGKQWSRVSKKFSLLLKSPSTYWKGQLMN